MDVCPKLDFNKQCKRQLTVVNSLKKTNKKKTTDMHKLASIFLQSSHEPASVAQDASIFTAGPTMITLHC